MDASDVYLAKVAQETIERQLERPINATIGTLNPDGSIHLAFVLFLWEDGKLYFETASMTRKARNVAARSTASFAVEGKGFMAMAEGIGRIIDGRDVDTVGAAWGTVDDVAVEITPTKWRSWSNEILSELGRASAEDLEPSEWWAPDSG